MANDILPGATLYQLAQWGFPMGHLRPTPDPNLAYSVIHWTATLATAEQEVVRRSDGSADRNNATFWVNRDGSFIQALGDPLHMDPWTNGDVQVPDISNPRIKAMMDDGVNANERSLVTIENVGTYGYPLTPEQEAACARIIAYYHDKAGLPISRETVIGHYQLNSINRPNCPGVDKSPIDRIVAMAKGEGSVKIKGTLVEWYNNRQTTIIERAGFTEDPTAMPYNNLHIFEVDTPFAVIAKVKGNFLGTTDEWYFGPAATTPPQMGYVIADHCGPLKQVEETNTADPELTARVTALEGEVTDREAAIRLLTGLIKNHTAASTQSEKNLAESAGIE